MKNLSVIRHRIALAEISPFSYKYVSDSNLEKITFSELRDFLKASAAKAFKTHKKQMGFKLSCSILDVYWLIKKYKLTKMFDYNDVKGCTYSGTQPSFPADLNCYVCCKNSMYGNRCFNLNISRYCIQMIVNPKSKQFKESFNLINPGHIPLSKIVICDIETTGLSEFDDDIIEIALFDMETKDYFEKMLPLKKKESIPEYISGLNHITNEMVASASELTQADINQITKRFNLKEKYLAIWSGSNLFDAVFLAVYFMDNGLIGFNQFSFINIKAYIQQNKLLYSNDFSKDFLASHLGISTESSHSALGDCLIEAEIVKYVFDLHHKEYDQSVVKDVVNCDVAENNAVELYNRLIEYCRNKNGPVLDDFDCNPFKRGSEWIDIHHIDETQLDNIAARTNQAREKNDIHTLNGLKKYNQSSRLVYATKVEHFLLHYIIEYLRGPGGGPHWLFGDLLRAQFQIKQTNNESDGWPDRLPNFSSVSFEQIVVLYKRILKKDHCTKEMVLPFYKLSVIDECLDNFINQLFE